MMAAFALLLAVACASAASPADDEQKKYRDMFQHSHSGKYPPLPGWNSDNHPWDEDLYPPLRPDNFMERRGRRVVAHLTSDSPAMNGSLITFTTSLEFPRCQREDARGDLVYDPTCRDENGKVHSGYVYNWTSWMQDYGFGQCTDPTKCNVFPDGTPFPQSYSWRRKNYIYVWRTMGQYFQTCGGSTSTLKLNTSNITLGAEIMEVMVYRLRDRRKYSPAAIDSGVYFITDKIPLAVNISQKAARNLSENVFVTDSDIIFKVLIHDPSNYLKTATSVNFIWDFRDGNRLVTHSNVASHTYSSAGNVTVKLIVEAAFRADCPPLTTTPESSSSRQTTAAATTPTPETHTVTSRVETTPGTTTARTRETTTTSTTTTSTPTTEMPVTTAAEGATDTPVDPVDHNSENKCFRYMFGTFEKEILIIDDALDANTIQASTIVEVSTSKVTDTVVHFLVKCMGSVPTSACTIISDAFCEKAKNVICNDIPPSAECKVMLKRTFLQPGTYCVNISLEGSSSFALASTHVTTNVTTHVTIGTGDKAVAKPLQATEVVLSASAILVAIFAFVGFMVYKRYRVYQPVRREAIVEHGPGRVGSRLGQLKAALFQANEEKSHLLSDRSPF
ncbi:protein QNR-71 isoform X1 [Scleropages formosus]|uniref:Glycoprotein nmb n=1 Tax=Scleropages formosus TaxID=113540 RepID=A0A8C9RSY6_SCLFO|nr:transmembrane glycoprotein NMB isoform X1 [Scleropages formosus]